MKQLVYDLTFTETVADTVTRAFDECTLRRSDDETIVRCAITDQTALHRLIDRIYRLNLELIAIHKVAD